MKLTFLGHSALLIEEGNFKGLVDPFITGNSLSKTSVDDLVNITHIFVTHGHGDHIGDTINIAKRNKALIITNHEISAYLSKFKLRTHA
ncbi:MAG TPA: MBL fold metallo-hydrolase, partial [Sedimentibacter sp.]|nr:MBL fold metallo-hydrolase [Sedimentibacter sp.]